MNIHGIDIEKNVDLAMKMSAVIGEHPVSVLVSFSQFSALNIIQKNDVLSACKEKINQRLDEHPFASIKDI